MIPKNTSIEFIPLQGDSINGNIIVDAIAEGGMARVYKVKSESLEVFRVLKLLKLSSDIDQDRFVTEARISANLNHPNVIQCYGFGKYKDKIPYIEMEYVDGINLHNLINSNGKIPVPVVLSIVLFICKALQALHTCSYTLYEVERFGVVHRDIKPANILISHKGEVKLADFGIAKPRDLSIHTSAIQVVGSIFYLSPEQLGKGDLDFRSDIYSLGCVMYEMITAKKAFNQSNISDIVVAKINNSYDLDPLRECSERLRNTLTTCLNPGREDRFESAEVLLGEIEELLKEAEIDDPQKTIRNYISHPKSFLSFSSQEEGRKVSIKFRHILPVFVIGIIIVLFGIIVYMKPGILQEAEKGEPAVLQSVPHLTTPDTIEHKKPAKSVSKVKSRKKATDTKRTTPKKLEAVEKKVMPKKSLKTAFVAFRRGQFTRCLNLLVEADDLNDTLFLCLLGSLVETGNYSRLSNLIKTKAVQDGYYYFLQGRIDYKKENFNAALKHFLKALTVDSFHKKLSYYSNYYIAKSKTALYFKTPNIVNKNVMLKSFDRFSTHFCKNPTSRECRDINVLYEKHK